jgi:pimeloyl-ACP methyl ester carboxylesterase
MTRLTETIITRFALAAILLALLAPAVQAQITTKTGNLPDGATFLIEAPANWNGTLFLYSHGYVVPGSPNPATDVGDPATRLFMLSSGYALAGSSYATTGWAIHEALPDQIAVLDAFTSMVGQPKRTIAWGHSLGGIITAGLIQRFPDRFTAALPMCGVLSGGVATWNTALDGAFAVKELLAANTPLQVVNIQNPSTNFFISEQVLSAAQATPQGRARIALGAALSDVPGWFAPLTPEPAATDFASQEMNQFLWDQQVDFPFIFAFRAELEFRAGGNVSWNTHVDYRRQFARSADRNEVEALYKIASLDLDADLDTLNDAARISAKEDAVEYLKQNIIFDGQIHIPVLTMHTTGDGLVVVENESAYDDVVDEAGNGRSLRQTFVHRAGHCAFTPAETVTAVQNLVSRLDTGKWPNLDDEALNAEAASLGPLNIFFAQGQVVPTAPAFVDFRPAPYLRPFDAFNRCGVHFDDRECHGGFDLFHDR